MDVVELQSSIPFAGTGQLWDALELDSIEIDFHVGKLSSPCGLYPTPTPVLLILCCFAVPMQCGAVHLGKTRR
jgi:hypothetical protein